MELNQFVWGALLLSVCALVHIVMIVYWTLLIEPVRKALEMLTEQFRAIILTCMTFFVLLLSHSFQVWLWAFVLHFRGALDTLDDSIYFTLISYTTVGYGDLVLDKGHRVLGAMSSVAGMLNFGLSTAYLVALFQHVLRQHSSLIQRIEPWTKNNGDEEHPH